MHLLDLRALASPAPRPRERPAWPRAPRRGVASFGLSRAVPMTPLGQIVVQERLDRARLGAGARDHDAVRRLAAVDGEQLARDGLVVPLLLGADAVVVGVLAPAGAALVAVEALAAGAVGAEPGQLLAVIGGDLEEPRAHAVEHDREQAAELVLDRRELAHERRVQSTARRDRWTTGSGSASNSPMRLAGEDARGPGSTGRLAGVRRYCCTRSRSRTTSS